MKKIFLSFVLLCALVACTRAEHYKTPFDTGGKVYKVALLPWQASAMNFEFKYRWTMTQALRNACRQSGVFDFLWSAYPVNGGNVQMLENVNGTQLWERKKYGRYEPDVNAVLKITSELGADLALLYNVSSDNAGSKGPDSFGEKSDSVRLFIVDANSGQVTVDFIRTDFLRKRASADTKTVTLRAFSKWLSEGK